jgi:hypothetical protein
MRKPTKTVVIERVVTTKETRTEYKTKPTSGECHRCGRDSHWVADCFATTHVNGEVLDKEELEWECDNCSRTFATRFGCMVHERTCR